MSPTVGQTLYSVTDSTAVIVVRATGEGTVTCGGAPMTTAKDAPQVPGDPGAGAATQLGKRYEDPAGTIEVLCTKAGSGTLALDGEALAIKSAKPLPASD